MTRLLLAAALGTAAFAGPASAELCQSPDREVLVVCVDDAPQGCLVYGSVLGGHFAAYCR